MRALLAGLLVVATLLGAAACGDDKEAGPPGATRVASPTAGPVLPTISPTAGPALPTISPTAEPGLPTTSPTQEPQPAGQGEVAWSEKPRATPPVAAEADLAELVAGNSAFAFDLYQALRTSEGNVFFSPYSISQALAMTYAGAAGETKRQMADTLSFTLPDDRLHPAFNALDLDIAHRGEGAGAKPSERFQLNIVNALWGQQGYAFLPEFLDVLAQNYGAGLRLLDFVGAPEESRITINDWVGDQTKGKIPELIPQGIFDEFTRFVLTNAIYFNAGWLFPFDPGHTQEGPFYLLDGGEVTVPMMKQRAELIYAEGEGYQVVSLPYGLSGLSMVLIVPQAGQFEAFEASLNAERVDAIVKGLGRWIVTLSMPKFDFESSFDLGETLAAMGMPDAFTKYVADFSGMTGRPELYIQAVFHKAFVSVDEEGTEAAAATAAVGGATSLPPSADLAIDRPFIFLIRDNESGAILFLGRVLNPAA